MNLAIRKLLFTAIFACFLIAGHNAFALDRLLPGETLYAGQSLTSQNGRFTLVMQGDGNLVLYPNGGQALWHTHTYNVASLQNGNGRAVFQLDGNFVIYDPQNVPRWNSKSFGSVGLLVMQNDGNLVIYDSNGAPIWSTQTAVVTTTVSVLVLYPQFVKDIYGGNPSAKIAHMINWTNQAFQNSRMDINLVLKGSEVLNLPNGQVSSDALLESLVYSDAVMGLRNRYQPDLTIYLTASGNGMCGIAYMPDVQRDSRGNFIRVREMAFKGVSVVGHNCSADTFAHEIGHNLGMGHGQRQNHPGYPLEYSRGYGVDGIFRTIMPYFEAYQAPYLQYFSNPDIARCAGLSCGTSTDNSAKGGQIVVQQYVQLYSACYPTTVSTSPRGSSVLSCGNNICMKTGPRGSCEQWQ